MPTEGRGRSRTRREPAQPRLLVADDAGRILDHPFLLAAGSSWDAPEPLGETSPAPDGLQLVFLPGRAPLGVDPSSGRIEPVTRFDFEGRRFRPHAVAAVLPPAHLRLLLPACERASGAPALPLRGYTAVGLAGDAFRVAARRIDPHSHWDPARFQASEIEPAVAAHLARFPHNGLVAQLAHCARDYGCCTAANFFLGTWEAALPVSPDCDARCLGCISEQAGESPSPQQRLGRAPGAGEIAEAAVYHLERAEPGMVSFGQGCEGEPSLHAGRIAEAIRAIRARTQRGTIHMNTNGSRPEALAELAAAGLQSVRVSLCSAHAEIFDAYHRAAFGLETVEDFARRAREAGLFVSLNLLVFPGLTDRVEELEALAGLLERCRLPMVQLRNLDLDPARLLSALPGPGGRCLGMGGFVAELARRLPELEIGSFNRFRHEFEGRLAPGRTNENLPSVS
ncbi:MAG: radical SAM protein [Deltaproteobacteria bacterium]|nr:radical SAM protein [Deltaproteobacteria bacterium]